MKVPYFRLAIERGKRDTLRKISASKLFHTHIMVLSNSATGGDQRVYKLTCHPWNWVFVNNTNTKSVPIQKIYPSSHLWDRGVNDNLPFQIANNVTLKVYKGSRFMNRIPTHRHLKKKRICIYQIFALVWFPSYQLKTTIPCSFYSTQRQQAAVRLSYLASSKVNQRVSKLTWI